MGTRLLKCPLCGEVVDAPIDGASKPMACPTCGGELAPPSKARAAIAASASSGRVAAVAGAGGGPRRPLASPRPVTPGEAISSSSASWIPDARSSSAVRPPAAPPTPARSSTPDWIRSPITYVVGGVLVLGLGIAVAMLMKGGGSSAPPQSHAQQASTVTPPAPIVTPPANLDLPSPTPIDLMAMVDLNQDVIEGNWRRQPDGSLAAEGNSRYNHVAFPYQPPAEYDLKVSFTRTGTNGDDAILTIFSDRTHMCTYIVNGWQKSIAAFNFIDHKAGLHTVTASQNHPINIGTRHTTLIKVRKNYIEGWLDGKMLAHYDTTGADLSMHPGWTLNGNTVGIGTMCPTTFHSAELTEISGRGKAEFKAPPAPTAAAAAPAKN